MEKRLSVVANGVLQRCAETVGSSLEALVDEFELGAGSAVEGYSRKLVEFCSSRVLGSLCRDGGEKVADPSFSRLTFDMMLAWERPGCNHEESLLESTSKEKEDRKEPLKGKEGQMHDDVPLFYSDLMPLLVDEEQSVGEDAFVWLASLLPLVADVVNARFAFEAFTECTAQRLHFPAYDRFLKEIDRCVKYLQKQSIPTGVELADDEFILVIRHIGATSWPGRLTLTNRSLYFEASGVISYENALKIDLAKPGVDHRLRAGSTGPWGAPLFDKAMIYESSQLGESIILEFPELTSSTRRDHWLSLTKEVILLHQFLSKFGIESPQERWEMQARTILGIIRLHAVREMLRIAPPVPRNFLIFTLFDELPRGLRTGRTVEDFQGGGPVAPMHLCCQERIRSPNRETGGIGVPGDDYQSSERGGERGIRRKSSVEGLKEEGISDSLLVLAELLKPVTSVLPWFQGLLRWERPARTLIALTVSLLIIYKEWAGYAIAVLLSWGVWMMLRARWMRIRNECMEISVSPTSSQSAMESLVSAQHGFNSLQDLVQKANIAILKSWSIFVSKAPKQANLVIAAASGVAVFLAVIPLRFVLMGLTALFFLAGSRGGHRDGPRNRRLREWWDSIPIVPVRILRQAPSSA
ncbi:unnamed protein product [Spirodela intermedia]|uniref:Uncharacterized protein n=1 Tax=Spirodela intermedia TaxID=51605 RepID=A0A7I8I800_SPIIN|nr:unnamed protein product [Spirodela intermedia]CAA6653777.1 unnamed protein product [Spirodela intermedia]